MKKSLYNKINTVKYGLLAIMFLVLPLSLGTREDIELNGLFILLAVVMGYMAYKYSKKTNEQGNQLMITNLPTMLQKQIR